MLLGDCAVIGGEDMGGDRVLAGLAQDRLEFETVVAGGHVVIGPEDTGPFAQGVRDLDAQLDP